MIFPANFEKESQRLTNLLELSFKLTGKTLPSKIHRVPVILHTQSVISNAMVLWAPKRMEYYTCPSQHSYAQEWLEQLAVHEFRHVVQMEKFNQGITKALYYPIGEQAVASILGLYLPLWWLEGDAVCSETGLTKTGRGRNPDFAMEVRAYTLAKKKYSYEKAIFGSYKDYIPDYYKIGYLLVANARNHYGYEMWDKTMNRIARRPYSITPFNKGIKTYTGGGKVKFYKSTMSELDSLWSLQLNQNTYTTFQRINKEKKGFANYDNPVYINDSLILVEKAGLDEMGKYIIVSKERGEKIPQISLKTHAESAAANVGRFVLIDRKGKEKTIFTPGSYYPETLAANDSLIVWSEKTYDPRWDNRNYAVIKKYDLKKHKAVQLTKKSRYFVPALSHDGKTIAVVEHTPVNECYIVLLDACNGKQIKKISAPQNYFLMTPSFSKDDKTIVAVAISGKGKGIITINTETNAVKIILPFDFTEIARPCYYKNYLLFTGAYSGVDNIYAIDKISSSIWQVTSSRLGAYDACVSKDESKLLYSEYTANGFDVAEMPLDPAKWKPLKEVKDNSIKLYEAIEKQEAGNICTQNADSIVFPVKNYRRIPHAINVHSWAPVSINIDKMSLQPGVSIMSQDKLSNTFATIGYAFNTQEQTGKYFAELSYRGLYPIFDLKYENGERADYSVDTAGIKTKYTWHESDLITGFRVPLNLSKGKYLRAIQPQISSTLINISPTALTPDTFINGAINTLDYRLYFFNILKSSIRDISPRWGQLFDFNYRHTPFNGNNLRSFFSAEAILNFPGLLKHHTIRLYGGYQQKKNYEYVFSDLLPYPHGYTKQSNAELKTGSVDYIFPLFYPDWKIGSLAYFKRFRGDLFFDYAEGLTKNITTYYCSTGIELYTDVHLLRFLAPFNLGVRYIYLPNSGKYQFEGLFAVDLSGL